MTRMFKLTEEDEYDRRAEQLKSACATCVYGFPAPIGYSCAISTRKAASDVIIRCGAYKRRSGAKVVEDD